MEAFVVVFQNKKERSDKRVVVIREKDIEKAFKVAKVLTKNTYINYKIKSISES